MRIFWLQLAHFSLLKACLFLTLFRQFLLEIFLFIIFFWNQPHNITLNDIRGSSMSSYSCHVQSIIFSYTVKAQMKWYMK